MRTTISITIDPAVLSAVDAVRGLTKRSTIINEMIKSVVTGNPQKFTSNDLNIPPQTRSAHE